MRPPGRVVRPYRSTDDPRHGPLPRASRRRAPRQGPAGRTARRALRAALAASSLAYGCAESQVPTAPQLRVAAPPPEPVPASYFGLHIHRATPTARFPSASAWPWVGFATWRLWDALVAWPDLEPEAGRWSFETLDRDVALAESRGVEVLLPLGLSPRWA